MKFPRVELHCHLDGALTPAVFYKFAIQKGIIDKGIDEETWRKQNVIAEAMPLVDCLKRFDLLTSLLQTPENLTEAAESLGNSLYEQGIRLAEIRFAPQLHTSCGMSQRDAVDAVVEGVKNVLNNHPDMILGVILCMMNCGPDVDNRSANAETVEIAAEYQNRGVVGIDLAGAEGANPTESYRPFFERAYELGLNITIHAGESCPADAVETALSMHAQRIGHGIHCWQDPRVAKKVIDQKIPLEICVTSNALSHCVMSVSEHPVREMMDKGVVVTISTDDPLLCGCSLQDEYDLLQKEFGFTETELIRINLNAARASFCPGKERIVEELTRCYEKNR